jgi:hypothetical protein
LFFVSGVLRVLRVLRDLRDNVSRNPRLVTVVLGYVALTVVFTWPLALGIHRDVPGDFGDALLNMWILGWNAEATPRLITGGLDWQGYWNANIYHPDPYALALSEHMFAQGLQIAPIYALTGNVILCYNLLFLSTFVLSAMGAYLLVRDLTGDWRAAVIAGLVYGFLPYRVNQIPHVQVLSSQWMPFALWGLHRYITRRSIRALAGASAALVLQHWSCGYYLLYFSPFVPIFVVHQLWAAGRLRDRRAWMWLAGAGALVALLSLPFLLPYREIQRLFGFARPLGEVVSFSANVWSYATAAESLHFWGWLRLHPHAEGETFLGAAAVVLALAGIGRSIQVARASAGERCHGVHGPAGPRRSLARRWRVWATRVAGVVLALQLVGLASVLLVGGFSFRVAGVSVRATTPVRLLVQVTVSVGLLLALSPRARRTAREWVASPVAWFAGIALLAAWLSLGPLPMTGPWRLSGFGLYGVLYEHVPGFTGVRAPARYAMVVGVCLAALAGYGAAVVARTRHGPAALALAGLLVFADGSAMPLQINHAWGVDEATPPSRVYPAAQAPPVYHRLAALPAGSAIAEFPFGDPAWELRYVYYAAVHLKPIMNGYSGSAPPGYARRLATLRQFRVDGDAAWRVLTDAGATHAVVHTSAFANPDAAAVLAAWLESRGCRILERFADGDVLYVLP